MGGTTAAAAAGCGCAVRQQVSAATCGSCFPPVSDCRLSYSRPGCEAMGKWAKYSKRYKKEWEDEADLKEWIVAVEGDDSKAACKFCNNRLRAHHSDLVSHATTVKHKRNSGLGIVVKREAGKAAKRRGRGPAKQEAVTVTELLGASPRHSQQANVLL